MRFNFRYPPKEAPQELKEAFSSDCGSQSKKDEIHEIERMKRGEWR